MFVSLLIGAIVMAGFLLLVDYTHRRGLNLKWWHWLLTVLSFIYVTFVLEVIHVFLLEGAGQGAFVVGLILAIIAVIWGVMLSRYVFAKRDQA